MRGWYTNNEISQTVMQAIAERGHEISHIKGFSDDLSGHIFYGILRGTAAAMRYCQFTNQSYFYLDNGYYDAEYIDRQGFKDMGGKYRIVKNDMIEQYIGTEIDGKSKDGNLFVIIPPSPYTANFYDTTPEDWLKEWVDVLSGKGFRYRIRDKKALQPLDHDLNAATALLSFNSMSGMTALKMGVPTYDTHGLFRNADRVLQDNFKPKVMYSYDAVRAFYEPKNFTLQEIAEGKSCL